MLERIRETFRSEYIGAILVALVVAQVVANAIGLAMMPVWFWAALHRQPQHSVFGTPEPPPLFNWNDFIASAVNFGLYVIVAFVLLRWLYLETAPRVIEDMESTGDGRD